MLLVLVAACKSDSPSEAEEITVPACNTGDFEWPDDAEPLWNNFEVTSVNRELARASSLTSLIFTE